MAMLTFTFSKRTACIALLVSVCAIEITHPEELQFQGQMLFGADTGFTALPCDDGDHITVASMLHHFWLVLPYSESWVFHTTRDVPLEAQDDQYVVTIKIVGKRSSSDRGHLGEIAQNLQASGNLEMRFVEYLEAHGRTVLRYQSRAVPGGPERVGNGWRWNYWAMAHRKRDRYVLHISTPARASAADSPGDQRLLGMIGAGFGADFDVK